MLKMLVRATALLVKGVAALLGVSSSVIILLCIIMIIRRFSPPRLRSSWQMKMQSQVHKSNR